MNFGVEGISTILQFLGENSLRLIGQQIIPQWTETGIIYTKPLISLGTLLNKAILCFGITDDG